MKLTSILKRMLEFDNTSLKIDLKNDILIDFFKKNELNLSEEQMAKYICDKLIIKDTFYYDKTKSILLIFNNEFNIYFLRDYLQENKFFSNFLDLLKSNDFNNKINYVNADGTYYIKELIENKRIFTSVVEKNNLNTGRIKETDLMIPPNLFNEIIAIESDTTIYEFLANFFSLFAISERTIINSSDTNDLFTFIINGEHNQELRLELKWPDFKNEKDISETNTKIKYFYDCYIWIINSNKEISTETLLSIVRNYIKSQGKFTLDTNWKHGLESILSQVIKGETDRYFDHVLKLRDEYKYLTDMKFDLRQKMMQRTLANLTAIAVGFFGKTFTDLAINDLNSKVSIFLNSDNILAAIFFYGFIVFGISIYLLDEEYKEIVRYYNQIKEIFVNKFLFNIREFEKVVGQIDNDPLIIKYRKLLCSLTIICLILGVMFLIGWEKLWIAFKNIYRFYTLQQM